MIPSDNPIQRPEEDVLGRAIVAQSFAQQLLALDVSEGAVVGVLGAWGSGKTSFVNLARRELERSDVPILDFNPWMFSGAEQLVQSFFVELAAQLKVRPGLAELGKDLQDYGEAFSGMAWLPVIGPWIERVRGAGKILAKVLQRRKEGVGGRRTRLEKALAELKKPIVVVLDDMDRLSTPEIRDVFKLVRLTASFPNIIYVVAFDRARVEQALAEQAVPGRDYLEKILQVAVDLPAVPHQVLSRQVLAAVDSALSDIERQGPFDDQVWPDVFMEIVRPLIRNMRDVRRYATAIHGTVTSLDGQVALADVLALEAVRVFLPDVFGRFHGAIEALTAVSPVRMGGGDDSQRLKPQIDGLIESHREKAAVVRALIERVFPAAQRHIGNMQYGQEWKRTWLKDRRVAHEDVLRLYLERVAGEGFRAFADAEEASRLMADRDALDRYLRSLEQERLEDVIASLEAFEDEFRSEHVVSGAIVLLNLLPDLPERQRGMFDFGTRMVVVRVLFRLMRRLGEPTEVERAARQILPEVNTLSAKLELIDTIGHREHVGAKLIGEDAAKELEKAWREEVRAASAENLAKERELFGTLLAARRGGDAAKPPEDPIAIPNSPQFTRALLQSARTEVKSQSMGSRALQRSYRLPWDLLVEMFGGDEVTLKERIKSLRTTDPEDKQELIELADKYASGWRPED